MMGEKPDLVRVLEHYQIDVRDINGNQLILCPSHPEDRPSCSVHVEKGVWNCKACLATGDALTIIEQREGLDFRGAVAFAEEHFGYQRADPRPQGRVGFGGRRSGSGGYRPAAARRGFTRS